MCKFLGTHKPDPAVTRYRERQDSDNPPFHENYHFEQYSTCSRCGEEISYARFFNWWGSKARFIDNNIREWLEESEETSPRSCLGQNVHGHRNEYPRNK